MLVADFASAKPSWGHEPLSLAAAHHDRTQRATP